MVNQFYEVFDKTLKFLGKWTMPGLKWAFFAAIAVMIGGLILFRLDREAFYRLRDDGKKWLRQTGTWVLILGLLLLQVQILYALRTGVIRRIQKESSARYTINDDPTGGATVQYAPRVAYQEITSRTQRLFVPRYALKYTNTPRWLTYIPDWAPNRIKYDTRPIIHIDDELEKDEKTVVIKRKITHFRFLPLKVKNSDVKLKLKFSDKQGGKRSRYYQADFAANYTFINPFEEKKLIHFTFPLPKNSGTLSEFHFKVNGVEYQVQDVTRGYRWEGEVNPRQTVNVEITYHHNGAEHWTYNLASRREPISNFRLEVESDNPSVKFRRGVLFPTSTSRKRGKTILVWDLKNQITSQDVSLYFSGASVAEQIYRLYTFAPVALAGFFLLVLAWSRVAGIPIRPWRIFTSTVAYSGGFALVSYLLSRLPMFWAVLLAFVAAGVVSQLVLDKKYLPVVIAVNLTPLAFAFSTNTGTLLSILGFATLAAFIGQAGKTPAQEDPPPVPKPQNQE